MAKNNFKNLEKALTKVKVYKTSAEKKEETTQINKRLAEIELWIDKSKEKRKLFMECVKNAIDENNIKILEKGIVVFVRRIEVISMLEEDLTGQGIEHRTISGKTTAKKRSIAEDWFNEDPKNKVVFISEAGGQSINLHCTNELILYNIPNGFGPFKQTVGRVARGFGKYDTYNIHVIAVEDSIDEYKGIAISSKKTLENELLHADSIPLKITGSFNSEVLKRIRKKLLWKK